MWKNSGGRDRSQMATWRIPIACWIPKATNKHTHTHTHSCCVILIAFYPTKIVACPRLNGNVICRSYSCELHTYLHLWLLGVARQLLAYSGSRHKTVGLLWVAIRNGWNSVIDRHVASHEFVYSNARTAALYSESYTKLPGLNLVHLNAKPVPPPKKQAFFYIYS